MVLIRIGLAATAAFLGSTGIAVAQDREPCGANLVCASSPDTVLNAMKSAKLDPKLTTDDTGAPMIEVDAQYHYDVFFYGCEKGTSRNCDSLQFAVLFEKTPGLDMPLVNEWNNSKRFMQLSFRTSDGTVTGRYDLATIGGINQRNFGDVLDWWGTMLGELGTFFDTKLPKDKATAPAAAVAPAPAKKP